MRLILLGAPGSGKGTQSERLCAQLHVPHIATGDIFREEIAKKTDLGLQAEACVKSGRLVPDPLVLSMVFKRLEQPDCLNGFLLDGFPRNTEQAKELEVYLNRKGLRLDLVIYLEAAQDVIVGRLSGRRYCGKCQMVYNLVTNPPKADSVCDRCAGQLLARPDDEPVTVRKRLMVYEELTSPLIAYYKATASFIAVDASRSVDEVTQDTMRHLEAKIK
ncbi:MAG: adenylate kinase [Elusimicrobia bacterium]|nr:adenylate kinase [Elusimicrobiota bacterium]